MPDWTYQFTEAKTSYETYEWGNFWIDHANDKDSKRIFYIGDSISGGIRPQLAALTADRFRIDSFATSMALDNPFLTEYISLCQKQLSLVSEKHDYLIFNNGLHGWHLSEDDYMHWYEKTAVYLLSTFSDSTVVFALTTAVADAQREERVAERNDCAAKIAKELGVQTIDLYTLSKQHPNLISADGVHYTEQGCTLFAQKIIEFIDKCEA